MKTSRGTFAPQAKQEGEKWEEEEGLEDKKVELRYLLLCFRPYIMRSFRQYSSGRSRVLVLLRTPLLVWVPAADDRMGMG